MLDAGREYRKRYPDAGRGAAKRWAAANAEHRKDYERRRTLRMTPEERERRRLREAKRRTDDPDYYRRVNKKSRAKRDHAAWMRDWRRKNPHLDKAISIKYRESHKAEIYIRSRKRTARVAILGSGIAESDWRQYRDGYGKCLRCGSIERLTMDHVVPIVVGGHHSLWNVQPLCRTCNARKHVTIADYRKYLPAPEGA